MEMNKFCKENIRKGIVANIILATMPFLIFIFQEHIQL